MAILTMLVLLLVVSAGCIGGPDSVADRDIVVLKLNADGVAQWTKTIDTGEDDGAEDLVEFPGGGFAIAAQNGSDPRHPARPRFIRLSPDGTVQWDRFVTEGSYIARAVVPVGNGGTAVLTGNGTVVRFDDAGRIVWTRATGVSEAQALLRLADGGLVAGGRVTYYTNTNITIPPVPGASALPDPARFVAGEEGMAARLSADGGIVWERRYGGSGLEQAQSLVESPDDAGVLLVGVGERANATPDTPFLALRLAPDGTPQTVVQLGIGGPRTAAVPSGGRAEPAGYRVLYWNDRSTPNLTQGSVTDAFLDRDGSVLECLDLNASLAVARTADGGYVSVGIPFGEGAGYSDFGWAPTSAFHTLRFDSRGALAWNRALPVGLISQVRKIVPTADGGYAVLALRTNE
ncbi:MAG: hypothetical protein ABFC38_05520 [Methanospirillum sp.]